MQIFHGTIHARPPLGSSLTFAFFWLSIASIDIWRLHTVTAFAPSFGRTGRFVRQENLAAHLRLETGDSIGPVEVIRHLTEASVRHQGQQEGIEALEALGVLCTRRLSYDFETTPEPGTGCVISPQRQLLSSKVTSDIFDQVRLMEKNGWLSTNPDSVDGLPSLHLNLVSNGKPSFPSKASSEFQQGIQKLFSIVKPHLYDILLPKVRKLVNSDSVTMSEVFLRRYGQDVLNGESRRGISAHFDVFSQVTAVIALDDVAAEGTSGLYTTTLSRTKNRDKNGKTSNHAALRRYFPLERGDAVVHTWDVLHGVDIEPGLDRTSLIIWFSRNKKEGEPDDAVSPWIAERPDLETNDVTQFVLGSALESALKQNDRGTASEPSENIMIHTDSIPSTTGHVEQHSHDLYLQSAASGNAFALTRLGSLFSEKKDIAPHRVAKAISVLNELRPNSELPPALQQCGPIEEDDVGVTFIQLAKRFWFEGAMRGNPVAQFSLADEIMEEAVRTANRESVLLASVLFGLAAQQGHDDAIDALNRVVQYEISQSIIESQEDFLSLPVVKTARAASAASSHLQEQEETTPL